MILKEINTLVVTYNLRTANIPEKQRLPLLLLIKAILFLVCIHILNCPCIPRLMWL